MAEGENMKKDIHPTVKDTTVTCVCGASFKTRSTKENIQVEVCSECHPYYTGAQGRVQKAGTVDKFNRKYGLNQNKAA